MHYRLEQRYAVPPDVLSRAFTDPALYELLAATPGLGRPEVLSREEDGDRVLLAVRRRFPGQLNGAARRALDPEKLSWVEHTVHDLPGGKVEFRLAPDNYADRFKASGRYSFSANGDGTLRVIEGEVTVKAPLVGGAVERAIVSGLADHLANEAPVIERWVGER